MSVGFVTASNEWITYGTGGDPLEGLQEFSLTFTFKLNASANGRRILGRWGSSNELHRSHLIQFTDFDEIGIVLQADQSSQLFRGQKTNNSLQAQTGVWYRFAASWEWAGGAGGGHIWYMSLNGSPLAHTTWFTNWTTEDLGIQTPSGTSDWFFGYETLTSNVSEDMDLCHVAYWNKAMNQAELDSVTSGYASPTQIRPDALTFYAPLQSTTQLNDVTGNYSGSIGGGTPDDKESPLLSEPHQILSISNRRPIPMKLSANRIRARTTEELQFHNPIGGDRALAPAANAHPSVMVADSGFRHPNTAWTESFYDYTIVNPANGQYEVGIGYYDDQEQLWYRADVYETSSNAHLGIAFGGNEEKIITIGSTYQEVGYRPTDIPVMMKWWAGGIVAQPKGTPQNSSATQLKMTGNTYFYSPFIVPDTGYFDGVGFRTDVANTGVMNFGLYEIGSNGYPTKLRASVTETGISLSGTGSKDGNFDQGIVYIEAGEYWGVWIANNESGLLETFDEPTGMAGYDEFGTAREAFIDNSTVSFTSAIADPFVTGRTAFSNTTIRRIKSKINYVDPYA